jgi:hypothetical protein
MIMTGIYTALLFNMEEAFDILDGCTTSVLVAELT